MFFIKSSLFIVSKRPLSIIPPRLFHHPSSSLWQQHSPTTNDSEVHHQVQDSTLSLSPIESKIFELLSKVVLKHTNNTTTLRVAGGWVRNKLLGIEAGDIDIAVNNMSGEAMAKKVQMYQRSCGLKGVRGVGVIKSNPSQVSRCFYK